MRMGGALSRFTKQSSKDGRSFLSVRLRRLAKEQGHGPAEEDCQQDTARAQGKGCKVAPTQTRTLALRGSRSRHGDQFHVEPFHRCSSWWLNRKADGRLSPV